MERMESQMQDQMDAEMAKNAEVDCRAPNCSDLKDCNCWEEMNEKLHEKGFVLSRKLLSLATDEKMNMRVVKHLPIERTDGKRLKRTDPQTVLMSYCPFCGSKL